MISTSFFAFHISHSNRKIQSLFDYVDPALRSFDVTHLDAGQCLWIVGPIFSIPLGKQISSP